MHPELPKPFKRYQIQPVWRADRPQPNQGRFREFYQCDVDTVGSASLVADAENIAVVHEGVLALGLRDFQVRVNNRKTLRGVVAWAGVARSARPTRSACSTSSTRSATDGVRAELAAAAFPRTRSTGCCSFAELRGAPAEVLGEAAEASSPARSRRATGLAETREILDHLAALAVDPARIVVDLSLDARARLLHRADLRGRARRPGEVREPRRRRPLRRPHRGLRRREDARRPESRSASRACSPRCSSSACSRPANRRSSGARDADAGRPGRGGAQDRVGPARGRPRRPRSTTRPTG